MLRKSRDSMKQGLLASSHDSVRHEHVISPQAKQMSGLLGSREGGPVSNREIGSMVEEMVPFTPIRVHIASLLNFAAGTLSYLGAVSGMTGTEMEKGVPQTVWELAGSSVLVLSLALLQLHTPPSPQVLSKA